MRYRIVVRDNFCRDHKPETLVQPCPPLTQEAAQQIADLMNQAAGPHSPDYYAVERWDYEAKKNEFIP